MSKIELSNEEIIALDRSLGFAGQFNFPVTAALKIAAITRKVGNAISDYQKVEKGIAFAHAERDEDGKGIFNKDKKGNKVPVIKDVEGYQKERGELLDETVEIDVPLFEKKDFDALRKIFESDEEGSGEKELPPAVLRAWVVLIDDSVNFDELFE